MIKSIEAWLSSIGQDDIIDLGTDGFFVLVFVLIVFLTVALVRLAFLHRYEELKSEARFFGKNSKSRDDTRANRALDGILGVGMRYQRLQLGVFLMRVVCWTIALACMGAAIWFGVDLLS